MHARQEARRIACQPVRYDSSMGLAKLKQKPVSERLMGIDASSKSIAFTVYADGKPVKWGKIFLEGDNTIEKCGDANKKMYVLMEEFDIDFLAIEEAIFVNNRRVVIMLSNIFGSIMGVAVAVGKTVVGVAPATWMNYIGNNTRPTKEEKEEINKQFPNKSKNWKKQQLKANRKQRTIDFFNEKYGMELTDDDVADSCGVGYYAYHELTRRPE